MTTPQNGSQGDTTSISNAGLPVSYGALIPDPDQPWAFRWGSDPLEAVTIVSYSFPSDSPENFAVWASGYSTLNENTVFSRLNTDQKHSVESALARWSSVANISFVKVTETATDVGQLRFAWTSVANEGAAAWAWFPSDFSASGGDVWLSEAGLGESDNVVADWQPGARAHSILIHELGHALGLKHPFDGVLKLTGAEDSQKYTVMSYTEHPHSLYLKQTSESTIDYRVIQPDSPMLYDIQAIQYLYGANTAYHAGDDVYTFDPATPFLRTLWDGAGNDTISVSNFSLGCTINLNPGSFSKLSMPFNVVPPGVTVTEAPTYDGTDNLAIAFNCWIENAVGGNGGDALIGNSLGNSLDGGAGIDTAVYTGVRAAYTITKVGAGWTVTDSVGGRDGSDTLTGIERLQFSDQTMALGLTQRDFGSDGKSDILLRNTGNGLVAIWQIEGSTIAGGGIPGSLGAGWGIVDSAGDYNGDGKSDILLQNANTGLVAIWQISGSTIVGGGVPGALGAGWTIADGAGDYNGDGKSDLLLHNTNTGLVATWQIDGSTIAGGGIPGSLSAGWTIVDGSGDYNGDGKSDVLLRNTNTNLVAIWQIDGSTIAGGGVPGALGVGWAIADGSGDYNGDGKSDILLRNTGNGLVATWQMNGSTIAGGGIPGSLGAGWVIADGSGDFNGDGMSDILLHNTNTEMIAIWQLNGSTISGGGVPGSIGGGWVIA